MRYGCLVGFFAVRAAVTMGSETLKEHSGQDLGRTHQAAGAAMQLLCDYCSVQSSTCPGTPGWQDDGGEPVQGHTHAGHAGTRDPGTQDPWETRLLLGSITLLRFYAWTAPTPGWRAAGRRESVCVPVSPTLQCDGTANAS